MTILGITTVLFLTYNIIEAPPSDVQNEISGRRQVKLPEGLPADVVEKIREAEKKGLKIPKNISAAMDIPMAKQSMKRGRMKAYMDAANSGVFDRPGGPPNLTGFQQSEYDKYRLEEEYNAYWKGGHWVYNRTYTRLPHVFTMYPPSKDDNRECEQFCSEVYKEYGAVCASRLNMRMWKYETRDFPNMCELEYFNCRFTNKARYCCVIGPHTSLRTILKQSKVLGAVLFRGKDWFPTHPGLCNVTHPVKTPDPGLSSILKITKELNDTFPEEKDIDLDMLEQNESIPMSTDLLPTIESRTLE